jgi:hypothetical protein
MRVRGDLSRRALPAGSVSGMFAWHKEAAIRKKFHFRLRVALAISLFFAPLPAGAAELKPEAVKGFDNYVRLTGSRMQAELAPGGVFLWVDGLPEPRRAEAQARLQRGEVISAKLLTADPSGHSSTPGALIHHWVGTIFIPGVSLTDVFVVVRDYDRHAEYYNPHVMQARAVEHSGDEFKVHYRLREKKIITIYLDADYTVHHYTLDAARAYSTSVSTRIAQVENPGEPGERELPLGKDGGYLWRLNSYWRYFAAGGGVYVQCEAVTLTRDIPTALNWLVGPFIESVPRESLDFTLLSTRSAVLRLHAGK